MPSGLAFAIPVDIENLEKMGQTADAVREKLRMAKLENKQLQDDIERSIAKGEDVTGARLDAMLASKTRVAELTYQSRLQKFAGDRKSVV